MTPENVPVAAPEPAGMGVFSRLVGVIFEPKKTFEDIARRPTFLVPMALAIVFGLVFMVAFSRRVGWEKVVRDRIESSSQAQQMSAEQKEQQIAIGAKFAAIGTYAVIIVGTPVMDLAIAGILLGIAAGMMSAPIKFKQAFAVVCWSYVVNCISAVLAVVVMFLKNPEDFDLNNPLMFNLGALFEPNMPSKFIHSLASSIDLFPFWIIFLMATGLKAAGGKRFSFGSALFAVVLPWGLFVLLKSAAAAIF
ncbi:MAG TPA: YIP1 family protein [Bryobacteraceae bacterium]|nr:YIP1 family protein [Bryobacteraceae bacterium]